jgi:hypothetical protein
VAVRARTFTPLGLAWASIKDLISLPLRRQPRECRGLWHYVRKGTFEIMDLDELDPGIREAVRVLRNSGIDTLSSCEGRKNPGYDPRRDGPHHGDWPYVTINGTSADAFIALGAAIKEGLSVRSIEQSWFVYPEAPSVPVGPQWRITFWQKSKAEE